MCYCLPPKVGRSLTSIHAHDEATHNEHLKGSCLERAGHQQRRGNGKSIVDEQCGLPARRSDPVRTMCCEAMAVSFRPPTEKPVTPTLRCATLNVGGIYTLCPGSRWGECLVVGFDFIDSEFYLAYLRQVIVQELGRAEKKQ